MTLDGWFFCFFTLGILALLIGLIYLLVGAVPVFGALTLVALFLILPAFTLSGIRWVTSLERHP